MEVLKDVTLHVYQLQTPADATSEGGSGGGVASFFSRLLPAVGMGAYHTTLEVGGSCYTFAANAGIVRESSRRALSHALPAGAVYQDAIPLGACSCRNAGEIQAVVQKLGDLYFTKTAYHLLHRNCNHFTETMATALILREEMIEHPNKNLKLKTYPQYINRLANSSKMVVGHDNDIVPCHVLEEARKAVGAEQKVGWDLSSNENNKSKKSSSKKQTKRELTEAQKKALAKIRGGTKK